jgi:hypothetical protein
MLRFKDWPPLNAFDSRARRRFAFWRSDFCSSFRSSAKRRKRNRFSAASLNVVYVGFELFGEADGFTSAENLGQSERPLFPSTSLKPETSRKVSAQKKIFFEKVFETTKRKKSGRKRNKRKEKQESANR